MSLGTYLQTYKQMTFNYIQRQCCQNHQGNNLLLFAQYVMWSALASFHCLVVQHAAEEGLLQPVL